jgi:hypothetical protein
MLASAPVGQDLGMRRAQMRGVQLVRMTPLMEFHVMIRKLIGALALTAVLATGARAQFTTPFDFVSGGSGFDSYSGKFTTGPNEALTGIPVNTTFQVWCVDPMQFVNPPNDAYTATVTPFSSGNFGSTMAVVVQSSTINGATHPVAASNSVAGTEYLEAAVLALQMNLHPTDQNYYEEAMWQIMGYTGKTPVGDQTTVNGYITYAQTHTSDVTLADWGIISDGTSKQEFIYECTSAGVAVACNPPGTPQSVTPEPSTVSLLAMGMLGMVGTSLRRRKRKK